MKITTTRKKAKSYFLINKSSKYKVKDVHQNHQGNYQRKSKTLEEQLIFKINQYDQQYRLTKNFNLKNKNYYQNYSKEFNFIAI